MNMMSLVFVAIVAFTYFGGQNVPKVLKDNKQMILGVFVGVLLHQFMGVGVEGIVSPPPEDICDCTTDECFNNNIISNCESHSEFCTNISSAVGNEGVNSNLSDLKCAVSRYEALLCGGIDCNREDQDVYKRLGGDQCWNDDGTPSDQLGDLPGFSGGQTVENIENAARTILDKSNSITNTLDKNYAICLLKRYTEIMTQNIENSDKGNNNQLNADMEVYVNHLNEAIQNLSN